MKSDELRNVVTEKVQATFKKYPAIGIVPKADEKAAYKATAMVQAPAEERDYLLALYDLFSRDPKLDLVGRRGLELVAG